MLFIVATPIGNLQDISLRALNVLQSVAVIAAEDTRHTKRLLTHFNINTPLLSLHDHNEAARAGQLIARLQAGEDIALVSDAGTPLISDPGFKLVRAVRNAGLTVSPVPGACAVIAALSASGLPTDRFLFAGFLPAKGAAREKAVAAYANETATLCVYESPRRIVGLLDLVVAQMGGTRQVVLARELTKTFETIHMAPAIEMRAWVQADSNQQRGELVVLVEGAPAPDSMDDIERLLLLLLPMMSLKQAVATVVTYFDVARKPVYQLALALQQALP